MMNWLATIIAAILGAVGMFFKRKSEEEQVAEVKDEQTQAAMHRPTDDGVVDRLRNGKF